MKCKFCGGSGNDYWGLNGVPYPCPVCNGTGECEYFDMDNKQLTNDEWRRTCSAEEFAKWMAQYCCDVNTRDVKEILKNEWLEWLKEKHTE